MKRIKWVWTPDQIKRIGTLSDRALAIELGLRQPVVSRMRIKLGIQCYVYRQPIFKWNATNIKRLGKASDSAIAKELGNTHRSVYWKRRQLGIPTFTAKPPSMERVRAAAQIRQARYRVRNKERYDELRRIWRENNHTRHLEYATRYRTNNPVKYKESLLKWAINNPEKIAENALKQNRKRASNRFQEGLAQFAALAKKLQSKAS